MASVTINKLSLRDYILPSQADDTNPTRYKIRPMNGMEHMDVLSITDLDENGHMRYKGPALKKVINYGLKGWENLLNSDGEEVKFSPAEINNLSPIDLHYIATEIINISELTGDERKNS